MARSCNGGCSCGRTGLHKEGRQWLLFKERDRFAATGKKADIVDRAAHSVVSGRDLDEIAADKDRVWTARGESKSPAARPHRSKVRPSKRSALPKRIDVELATLVDEPPPGDEWLHEIKFDGYRMICRIDDGEVQFLTRESQELDGPAGVAGGRSRQVAGPDRDPTSRSSPRRWDDRLSEAPERLSRQAGGRLVCLVFDLLHLDGVDLSAKPLDERKRLLATLLESKGSAAIRFSEHVEGNGAEFFEHGCEMHVEGIISKRAMLRIGRAGGRTG